MPSSHANSLFFFATSIAARLGRGNSSLGWSSGSLVVDVVATGVCFAYACAISGTRVYIEGDHTIEQVVAGVVLGSTCAVVNEVFVRPWVVPL
jgi:membrane-associated phospholipid phosphatase